MAPGPEWYRRWCKDRCGDQEKCYHSHVAIAALGPSKGEPGHLRYRCPVPEHDDRGYQCYINPGTGPNPCWMVWHCLTCTDEAVRAALSALGIDEDCLGSFGTAGYAVEVRSCDEADARQAALLTAAMVDQRRLHAILLLPAKLSGYEMRMCQILICDSAADLAPDPAVLIGSMSYEGAAEMARTIGASKSTSYRIAERWCAQQMPEAG